MKIASILSAACLLLSSCADYPQEVIKKIARTGRARVTIYDPTEVDKIKVRTGRRCFWKRVCYGKHTSSGVTARQGVTVAAPPEVPFGTKVKFPQLKNTFLGEGPYVVQDRGAGQRIFHTREWFDLYVCNSQLRRKLQRILPDWMEYQIVQ